MMTSESDVELQRRRARAHARRSTSPHDADGVAAIEHLTDVGNAQRFAFQHARSVRYCERLGGWYVWDGRRYLRDEIGQVVQLAQQTARSIWSEVELTTDSAERKRIADHAHKSEAEPRIRAMLTLAKADRAIATSAQAFDQDPFLLNVTNGTIDLRTADLRPHRHEDLITKLAPVDYDPDATCPTFDRFLERILPSAALRHFLQKALGYSLTADVREQILLLLHGRGANGKTTLLELLRAMLGDYARQAEFSTFIARRNDETVRNDLARLVGARFVAAIEVESGKRLAEATVKHLTGGDTVTARFLYREHFEFTPSFKLWLAVNYLPRVRGADHAIWRRLRRLPFEVMIPEHEQDKDLPAKLRAELPGILRWAIDGCLAWQRNSLGEPEEVRAATAEYREQQDILGIFLDERCGLDAAARCPAHQLYDAYTRWCETARERAMTQRAFGQELTTRGFQRGRDALGRKVYLGIFVQNPDGEE